MTTNPTIDGVPRQDIKAACELIEVLWESLQRHSSPQDNCYTIDEVVEKGHLPELAKLRALLDAEQPAPVASPLNYGSLDAVQRLAVCRGDVLPVSAAPAEPDRIKGMVETIGGQYAVMIDPENGHYGWTFKKHPDGQWVSGRKATEREMIAARSHAQITNQL